MIHFRAWHKKEKKMYYDLILSLDNNGIYWLRKYAKKWWGSGFKFIGGIDDFDILWSTGLNDSNGNEIFEGDIINIDKKGWNESLKVYWYKGFYRAISGDGVADASVCDFNDNNCEVIGNIHENPELLKVKK